MGEAIRRRYIERSETRALRAAGKKWCPRCKRAKPLTLFSSKKGSADGLSGYCRKCKYKVECDRKARRQGEADLTIAARWHAAIDQSHGQEGCWNWTARIDRYGYGRIMFQNRNISAARVGFMLATGRELQTHQKLRCFCGNRRCVRPGADHWDVPRMANAPKLVTNRGKSLRARRDRRILAEVEAAISPALPDEIREEMRQELTLAALTGGKVTGRAERMHVTPRKIELAERIARERAFGHLHGISIDAPLNADDDDEFTFRDTFVDTSIFADPLTLLEVGRRFEADGESADAP